MGLVVLTTLWLSSLSHVDRHVHRAVVSAREFLKEAGDEVYMPRRKGSVI